MGALAVEVGEAVDAVGEGRGAQGCRQGAQRPGVGKVERRLLPHVGVSQGIFFPAHHVAAVGAYFVEITERGAARHLQRGVPMLAVGRLHGRVGGFAV